MASLLMMPAILVFYCLKALPKYWYLLPQRANHANSERI